MPRRVAACCVALLVVACASGARPPATPIPDAQGTTGAPNISIVSPVNGATYDAGNVEVVVEVEEFELVKPIGARPADGEGHVVYYVDAGQIPTVPGRSARSDAESFHASAKLSYVWRDVEAGPHRFAVQLVNNDDTPLEPPVTAETAVTVERD